MRTRAFAFRSRRITSRVPTGAFPSSYLGRFSFTCEHNYCLISYSSHSSFSLFITFTTFLLLGTQAPSPDHALPRHLSLWATFLGVTSAGLAVLQYAPQLVHTYKSKLVGALSIPMMCIQTPGTTFMVVSIILR